MYHVSLCTCTPWGGIDALMVGAVPTHVPTCPCTAYGSDVWVLMAQGGSVYQNWLAKTQAKMRKKHVDPIYRRVDTFVMLLVSIVQVRLMLILWSGSSYMHIVLCACASCAWSFQRCRT